MFPDQWLVQKFAQLFYARYQRVLGKEAHKWQQTAEKYRRVQLMKQLGRCGHAIKLEEGVQILAPGQVQLGDHVALGYNAILRGQGGITLGDFTLLGDYVILATAGHPVGELYIHNTFKAPIIIGQNVWLAAGVIVLPGVTIGDNAVVGAGAVVSEDIPPDSIAVGVPARVVKPIEADAALRDLQKQTLRERRQHWDTRPPSRHF